MIVFDMFIDIKSTDKFSDLFFQIFMISSEKSDPVKIEVAVLQCLSTGFLNHTLDWDVIILLLIKLLIPSDSTIDNVYNI